MSRDVFQGFEQNPISLHKYIYTENDPVNNVDPDGYYKLVWTNKTNGYIRFSPSDLNRYSGKLAIGSGVIGGLSLLAGLFPVLKPASFLLGAFATILGIGAGYIQYLNANGFGAIVSIRRVKKRWKMGPLSVTKKVAWPTGIRGCNKPYNASKPWLC